MTIFSQQSYDYEKGKVKLFWQEPLINGSPISSYTILKDIGSGVYYEIYKGLGLSFVDSNLVDGQSYNYKIYATNGAGDGIESAILIGVAGELPGKVTSVSIVLQS